MALRTIAAAASIFLAMASGASAATLTIDNGQLTGATGVDVNGTLYDVTFVDGTCVALFDGCDSVDDFTFTTKSDALAASRALLDQVLINDGSYLFDSTPALTTGCGATLYCTIYTPYSDYTTDFALVYGAYNDAGTGAGGFIGGFVYTNVDLGGSDYLVFAAWTEASLAPVPLPAGGLLLLGGLGGFAALKRRKKRAA